VLFAVAILNLATLEWRISHNSRPERVVARSLLLMSALTVAAIGLTGGWKSPLLVLPVLPVAMTAARFRVSVVRLGAAITGAAMVAVCLAVNARQTFAHPSYLIVTLTSMVGVVEIAAALTGAEMQYRSQAVLDPLTGLLNRGGLEGRFAEIAEQARLLGRAVCVITCDIDHFKSINDGHGHDRGDAVLRDVTYAMRKTLRSFELFYRVGGEEFAILLPGVDLSLGATFAERLRATVEGSRAGGLAITMSFGVAAASGDEIAFESLFKRADDALYRAKAAGRNRVVADGELGDAEAGSDPQLGGEPELSTAGAAAAARGD
jgi:diguanylate cyclase (GGDEF)-like protein